MIKKLVSKHISCDCLDPDHFVHLFYDIEEVSYKEDKDYEGWLYLSLNNSQLTTFWTKLKWAWKILRGGRSIFNDVTLDKDSTEILRDELNKYLKFYLGQNKVTKKMAKEAAKKVLSKKEKGNV